MKAYIYRLRYIIAGVRILLEHGWPLIGAWRAVADDYDAGDWASWRAEGYTPAQAASESLSYWGE